MTPTPSPRSLRCSRRGAAAAYHASDAFPARRRDVVTWIAEQLGIEPPHRAMQDVSLGRGGANRRVLAFATRRELGLTLSFPSFREGLAPHILDAFEP